MSLIGSFTLTRHFSSPVALAAVGMLTSIYQLDFVTPGRRPTDASSRKQMRQTPNLRMYDRLRPHNWQRLTRRVWNFAGFAALTIKLFFAIAHPFVAPSWHAR
jgi:hypothetical protein